MRRIRAVSVMATLLWLALAAPTLGSGITNAGDDLRTGWYPNQPSITPQLVSGGSFGQMWSATVDGQVYAQPLLTNGTLLVATENNKVYGLDPATGALKWSKALNLGTPWNPSDIGCGDLTPSIGVTSTPVIDPATNTAYLTHKTYASGSSGPARWYMDAVDVSSGVEKPGFPVELSGAAQNASGSTFFATDQLQRPGLLLMGGVVYAGFGSHCDVPPWQGWVFGVSTAGQVKARWVANTTEEGAGIWQSGVGLTSDGSGSILLSTGNGGAPSTPAPGNAPPPNLGESIVRLHVQPDGSLKAVDFFAPFDATSLDSFDSDFGSGGVTGLPDAYFGTATLPHLAVAVGKQGYVYLLNRDSLGGIAQGLEGSDKVVQRLGPRGGVWSRPGVWPGDGGYIYIPTSSGSSGGGNLDVYKYGLSGGGQPSLSLQASSEDSFGWGSGAPVITSDGTISGSSLVWVIWSTNRTGSGGQLRAYDPVPVNGRPVLRFKAPIGTASNYSTPGVGAGRLYVGTRQGKVLAFGSPVTPPLSGSAVAFPTTTLGSTSQRILTLTANEVLTLSSLSSSSSQFTLGAPSPALPATLGAGQTISVAVTFAPTQAGIVGGSVTATTSTGKTTAFALSGIGQAATAQLAVTPRLVSFGGTAVGGHLTSTATFRNAGGTALTINKVNLPAAPFSATGTPKAGDTIASGASITVTVAFDPTKAGTFSGSIGLETTGGNGSIGLSGSAGSPGVLKISSETNDFGQVTVGASAVKSFTITNTGGTTVTITKSKPPVGGAFAATTTLPEGSTIAPGASITETVTFAPTAPGSAAGNWQINGNDTTGLHQVQFSGVGGVQAPGSWTSNGTASISGPAFTLTGTATYSAGSSFLETPVDSHQLAVSFDSTIGGGTGADGQALVLADPGRGATTTSLGEIGGGLGFSGIPGIAVAFVTYQSPGAPSANFAGITDGPSGSPSGGMHWLATSTAIPSLRATRHIKVEVLNGTITMWIDGTQVLSKAVTLPAQTLLGFSAGSGYLTDNHQVSNVTVDGEAPPPKAATLKLSNTVAAPAGSPQASTQMVFSGSCPSSFTTAALGNGGSAAPALPAAVAGSPCTVSEPAPATAGGTWKTTASVNGGPEVALTATSGQLTVPAFALVAGANTVSFKNTWTAPAAATLKLTNAVHAPAGSTQASATFTFSGKCPPSFTTAALANGGSATPTLTGAVAGTSCTITEPVPAAVSGAKWTVTASVNSRAAQSLPVVNGTATLPSFALVAGVNTVAFTNTYQSSAPLLPDPSAGGWQLNGSSTISGRELVLTPATEEQAGSAFWPQPIDARAVRVEYDVNIGGGSGADGLALVFADASKGANPTSLGAYGGGLGFSGIPGIAVALDEYQNAANPSANFTGITDGPTAGAADLLHWLGTATLLAPLQEATHHVTITTNGGMIVVAIDGTQVLSQAVTLPAGAYLGFSAGTGGLTNRHAVSNVMVTPAG